MCMATTQSAHGLRDSLGAGGVPPEALHPTRLCHAGALDQIIRHLKSFKLLGEHQG